MFSLVLGTTKSGKSTFAATLQQTTKNQTTHMYEAGSWARKGFAQTQEAMKFTDEMDPHFKNALTEYAKLELHCNPRVSIEAFEQWLSESNVDCLNDHVIIVGVRNPEDFMHITRKTDCRVFALRDRIQHQGSIAQFEQGLVAIREYAKWRTTNTKNPISWIDIPANMTFATVSDLTTMLETL